MVTNRWGVGLVAGTVMTVSAGLGWPIASADEPASPPVLGTLRLAPVSVALDGGSVDVTVAATDPDGDLTTVVATASAGRGDMTAATLGATGADDDWSGVLNLPANGTDRSDVWTVEITAVDGAGHSATAVLGSIDQAGPDGLDEHPTVTADVGPDSLDSAGGEVTVTATATDDRSVSEVGAVVSGDDGSSWVLSLESTGGSSYAATWTAPANAGDADRYYTVLVSATDDLGHEGFANAGQVVVAPAPSLPDDDIDDPPTISGADLDPRALPWDGGVVGIRVQASDDRQLAAVSVDITMAEGDVRRVPLTRTAGSSYGQLVQLPSNQGPDDQVYRFVARATDSGGQVDTLDLGDVVVESAPWLAVAAPSVILPTTRPHAASRRIVRVTNTGSSSITVDLAGLRAPFRVRGKTHLRIAPGATRLVVVVFQAKRPGRYSDRLLIRRSDGVQPRLGVRLTGRARAG